MLMAQDMDRALRFYRDTMGLTPGFTSSHWSELHSGDAIVALHDGGDGSRRDTGLSLQYADVRQAYERALAAGAQSIDPPYQREGEPIILGFLADPEGNIIMLTQFVGQ